MSSALKVKIFDAKGTQILPVAKSTVTVGSASHCDVVLNHPSVQPEHIRAWSEGGRIWVQDLGGATGTFLNGIRLPALKPMLVRELDILKLGECPSTLGLEPNLVRAPVVKAKATTDISEFTITDITALTSKRDLEKTVVRAPVEAPKALEVPGAMSESSREIAELKLQLQMARLDQRALSEMRQELEAKSVELERAARDLQQVDQERKASRKTFEDELSEARLKALRDLKEQREEEARKIETWRAVCHTKLKFEIGQLSEQKAKAWITRPISKDMIFEWEHDLDVLLRRHLLGEVDQDERTMTSLPAIPVAPPSGSVTGVRPLTKTGITAVSKIRQKTVKTVTGVRAFPLKGVLPLWAWMGIAVAVLALALAWYYGTGIRARFVPRDVASEETVPLPAFKGQSRYAPPQSADFKDSYTDNVLYTTRYVDAEMGVEFRKAWAAELARAARGELKLEPSLMLGIMEKEKSLITDLKQIRASITTNEEEKQGIARMRAREAQFMLELQERIGKKTPAERFIRVKRSFFERNPVYLNR